MNAEWEDRFRTWAKPLGPTEADRCNNAERMVKKAIDASDALSSKSIRVFAQGSYRNNTNVRQDSDVDICVLCTDTLFTDYAEGITASTAGIGPPTYCFSSFRNDVGRP